MITDTTAAALVLFVAAVADRLSTLTLHEVTREFIDGNISQAAYEGYRHVWALGHNRSEWFTRPDGAAGEFADAVSHRCPAPAQLSDWA